MRGNGLLWATHIHRCLGCQKQGVPYKWLPILRADETGCPVISCCPFLTKQLDSKQSVRELPPVREHHPDCSTPGEVFSLGGKKN